MKNSFSKNALILVVGFAAAAIFAVGLLGCEPPTGTGTTTKKRGTAEEPEVIKVGSDMSKALSDLASSVEDGGFYELALSEAEMTFTPQTLDFGGKTVSITLAYTPPSVAQSKMMRAASESGGDESGEIVVSGMTMSLSEGKSGSMFTIGSGVTLILGSGVTLLGKDDNTASLVVVNAGAALVMKDGSAISGNKIAGPTAVGGGVFVIGGSLTMEGGEISGNEAASGGGVAMLGGVFTMNSGTISGNKADTSGGGIILNGGEFTMNGSATISENEARSLGGGVYVMGGTFKMGEDGVLAMNEDAYDDDGNFIGKSGTFTMLGGTISENQATGSPGSGGSSSYLFSSSGGVSVGLGGVFIMESGAIIEKNTAANISHGGGVGIFSGTFTMNGGFIKENDAKSGGGVYVGSNGGVSASGTVGGPSTVIYEGVLGTFTMTGGVISGNNATGTEGSGHGGGGVCLDGGKFFKTGGTVYGSDGDDDDLKNTALDGAALYAAYANNTTNNTITSSLTVDTPYSYTYTQSTGGQQQD